MNKKITKFPILFVVLIISISVISSIYLFSFALNGGQIDGDWTNYIKYISKLLLYASIAVILWSEKEHPENFHLDRTTLILIGVFGILTSRFDIHYENYLKITVSVISIIIFAGAIKNWRKIPKSKWGWVGIAIATSGILLELSAFFEAFYPTIYAGMKIEPGRLGVYILRGILYNLSFVSIFEEVLFRGMLWGYLKRAGMQESSAFWIQAAVFWLLHIWRVGNPLYFFISLPLGILFDSLLTHYSKQVLPSIVTHTIINVGVPVIVYYFFL